MAKKTQTKKTMNKPMEQNADSKTRHTTKRGSSVHMNPIQKVVKSVDVPGKMEGMGKNMGKMAKKIDPTTVAKGAAVVSVAAGAVAAGALMMDKNNRRAISKNASKGVDVLRTIATDLMEEGQTQYQAAAHTVTNEKKKSDSNSKKSRGKSKR